MCGWLYTSVSECVYGVRDLENLDPEVHRFQVKFLIIPKGVVTRTSFPDSQNRQL